MEFADVCRLLDETEDLRTLLANKDVMWQLVNPDLTNALLHLPQYKGKYAEASNAAESLALFRQLAQYGQWGGPDWTAFYEFAMHVANISNTGTTTVWNLINAYNGVWGTIEILPMVKKTFQCWLKDRDNFALVLKNVYGPTPVAMEGPAEIKNKTRLFLLRNGLLDLDIDGKLSPDAALRLKQQIPNWADYAEVIRT
jgi:hypothetical protein